MCIWVLFSSISLSSFPRQISTDASPWLHLWLDLQAWSWVSSSISSEHCLKLELDFTFWLQSWGWGKGSAFQLGWSAWLLDDSTEYISPGDFPAADCWVQLEAYMSSHFIIFIHLAAQVFALAGCSWLAVNSQLLFSWNPTAKIVGQYDRKPNWDLNKNVQD